MEELIIKNRQLLTQLEQQLNTKKATVIEVSDTVIKINECCSSMLVECQQRLDRTN